MRSDKKLICVVSNDLNQDQRMQRICHSLSQNGFNVELIGRRKKESQDFRPDSYSSKRINCVFTKNWPFYLEFNIRVFWILLWNSFDLVNAVDLDTLPSCRLISWIKSKPLIFDAHEYFSEVPELNGSRIKKRIWKTLGRLFLTNSAYNYTVNYSLKTVLEENYHINFSVFPNYPFHHPIQNDHSQLNPPVRVIYQGVINKGRGLELILDVAPDMEGVIFIFVGTGDLLDSLISEITKRNLHSKILLKGFLNPGELSAFTRSCHIGLNLLDDKSKNNYYSLANKFFDYSMAGIPSISMDFPEYRRYNEKIKTGVLLKKLSAVNIKNALNKLIKDKELYLQLKRNCFRANSINNWQNVEKELVAFYHNIKNP